ncbi:MAG: GNAT family N-acetyltransferase [Lachnospiraceae bacterium]|nr:GNAT family N-acetyltransferase [Lachnospiraceae bacterium]
MEEKLYFRRTEERDLDAVIEIVDAAKEYLRLQGIPQWQDGYPNRESFYKDIEREISYVLEENGKILGTIAIDLEGDRNYNWIYEGNWLSEKQPYAAIHRVAVDAERKGSGLAGKMIEEAVKLCLEKGIFSIKNDTHRLNQSMQRMLVKNGFVRCGIIYLENGEERIGFERILSFC